jgi:hypothetical protein
MPPAALLAGDERYSAKPSQEKGPHGGGPLFRLPASKW